jgi:hypothetical protein
MAKYVKRGGQWVHHSTGAPFLTDAERSRPIGCPTIISDIPEYASPIDGRMITSRSERRDDLRRNGCVEYEPSLSPTKGKIRNKAFAAKRGLQVSEDFR